MFARVAGLPAGYRRPRHRRPRAADRVHVAAFRHHLEGGHVKTMRSASSSALRGPRAIDAPPPRATRVATAPDPGTPREGPRIKRLIAGREYFGIDASVLHAGAERMLERVASSKPQLRRVDQRALAEDFGVAGTASSALLTELLKGGLLQPDGVGSYAPTALLKEYASAYVVMPLSRERARALVERVGDLAVRVNAKWTRNRYVIEAVAVSGSYMSRRNPLDDLSLWLVLRSRVDGHSVQADAPLTSDRDARQIGAAMKALSSFIRVRVVADRQAVERPFAILFQAEDAVVEHHVPALGTWWDRAVSSVVGGVKSSVRGRSSR
jgi:hypothetical protein